MNNYKSQNLLQCCRPFAVLLALFFSLFLSINAQASLEQELAGAAPYLSAKELSTVTRYGQKLVRYHRHFQTISASDEKTQVRKMVIALDVAKAEYMNKKNITDTSPELEALSIRRVEEKYAAEIGRMFIALREAKGYFAFFMDAYNEFHHYALTQDTLDDSIMMTAAFYATTYNKRNGLPEGSGEAQSTMHQFTERAETIAGIQNYIHMKRFNLTRQELEKHYQKHNYTNTELMKKVLTNELYSKN